MTIKDLSRITGYSVGTISRVLNDQPNVSQKARQLILAQVASSGFQLNSNAKRLKQQRGEGILAVVTGTTNELFARMIVHIQRELAQTNYPLSVDYVDEEENAVAHALQLVREKKPRGILFLGGDARYFSESFGGIEIPSVLLTADAAELNFPNLSSVTTDDTAAAESAIDYLVARGHRKIGIISGDRDCDGPSRRRYNGCCRALARHGLGLPDERCEISRFSYPDAYAAAERLARRGDITAIFAMSDVMAIGAIRALEDRGLRVPGDISVIGYDGLELGDYFVPRLTTIRQKADLLAHRAIAVLRGAMECGGPARHEQIPFELAEYASVATKEGANP